MRIFELKQEQETVLESLSWCETEEEIKEELTKLNLIIKGIESKLDFWVPLLKESDAELDIAKMKKKMAVESHDKNIKRKESRAAWIRQHVLSLMVDFKIDKFDCNQFKVSHGLTAGALVFSENFDASLLPEGFVEIKEVVEIDKKALMDALRLSIYNEELKKLEQNTAIVELAEFPGVILERRESLRIL